MSVQSNKKDRWPPLVLMSILIMNIAHASNLPPKLVGSPPSQFSRILVLESLGVSVLPRTFPKAFLEA
jgi:hypothetical protein